MFSNYLKDMLRSNLETRRMKKLTYRQKRIWACTRILRRLRRELATYDWPYWVTLGDIDYYEEELERLEIIL